MTADNMPNASDDSFTIAGKRYQSRLLVGTGKYKDMDETRRAIDASGAEIITIAVRRTNMGQKRD
jgi:thiazole synthase